MLEPWEEALSIKEKVFPNLLRVFYLNIKLSTTSQGRIITNVGKVPIGLILEI